MCCSTQSRCQIVNRLLFTDDSVLTGVLEFIASKFEKRVALKCTRPTCAPVKSLTGWLHYDKFIIYLCERWESSDSHERFWGIIKELFHADLRRALSRTSTGHIWWHNWDKEQCARTFPLSSVSIIVHRDARPMHAIFLCFAVTVQLSPPRIISGNLDSPTRLRKEESSGDLYSNHRDCVLSRPRQAALAHVSIPSLSSC